MKNEGKGCVTLIGRFFLGVMLLGAGVGKFMMGYSAYLDKMLPGLTEMQFIPWALGAGFLYILPVLEVAVGVALLFGIRTSCTFGIAGLLFAMLSLGQFFMSNYDGAAHNGVYVAVSLICLWVASEGHDKWALG